MSALRFVLGLTCAVVLHAAGLAIDPRFATLVDPFLVVVVIQALRHPPIGSAFAGSAVGLTQDALSGGLFGLHGFAATAVAWLATITRQRFVIQQPAQVGMLCLVAAAFQQIVLAVLRFALVPGSEPPDVLEGVTKMATSAVLGALFVAATDRGSAWLGHRREARSRRLRLD
ncbi:MAG: rod shape-determining protein MreD [Acidobacteriota bacterium]